jgi:hypothetical protein
MVVGIVLAERFLDRSNARSSNIGDVTDNCQVSFAVCDISTSSAACDQSVFCSAVIIPKASDPWIPRATSPSSS